MLEDLRQFRRELDQAITMLERLAPLLDAWRGTPASQSAAEGIAKAPLPTDAPAAEPSEPASPPPPPGNGAEIGEQAICEYCGEAFVRHRGPGGRRLYCSTACRGSASAARARERKQAAEAATEAEAGLEPLPAAVERPFARVGHPDDPRSDPAALRPPPLEWELEAGAT